MKKGDRVRIMEDFYSLVNYNSLVSPAQIHISMAGAACRRYTLEETRIFWQGLATGDKLLVLEEPQQLGRFWFVKVYHATKGLGYYPVKYLRSF